MRSRDKRLPLDAWNLSEPQGNVFGNRRAMFESSQTLYQGILHSTTPSATGAVPVQGSTGTLVATGEERIGSTTTMPMSERRPSTMNPLLFVETPRISMAGQQRQQISEVQFDKFTTLFTFFMLENKIQNPGNYMFRFSIGGSVMDLRSGDGRFSGWTEVIHDQLRARSSQFRAAGRENSFYFEQHHPEFPLQKDVHRIHIHSVHDVHTAYSQARTNLNACLWLKWWWLSCIIFVRLKESIFRSAMSHPCWSFPHLLTSSPPHAAVSGPRDLLQDNTVHRQPLPQEPLQPLPEQLPHEPFPANAIRSENNAKESLSDPEYESAGNLRINTPTKEGQSRGTESSERRSVSSRKADRLHDLRLLPSHWRSWYRSWLRRFVSLSLFATTVLDGMKFYCLWPRYRLMMFWEVCTNCEHASLIKSKLFQNCTKDIDAQLSNIENDGEEKHRSETSITKLWRQTWEKWDRSSGYESQGIKWHWERKRNLLSVESKKVSVRGETNAVSGTRVTIVQNRHRK